MGIKQIVKKNLLEPALERVYKTFNLGKSKGSKEQWAQKAQKGEFSFHKTNKWRSGPEFMESTIMLFDSFGFHRDQYKDKTVVDLGAGSKLRCKYFNDAKWVVIEPMADQCIAEIPWCDLTDAETVYSRPAEEFIPELENSVDLLFSINVLDHCYDFEQIVENVHKYLKKDGMAFLSFDSHFVTDEMHPLILTDKICTDIFEKIGFTIQKKNKGFFGEFKANRNIDTYGHGSYCLNYWLTK